jgi:hypothetical protein
MQAVRGLLRSRWGVVRRMNHQAGPDADGADANAVERIPGNGAAAADAAENEAGHAAGLEGKTEADAATADAAENEARHAAGHEGQADADGATGEATDHEVAAAAAEPARLETGEPRVDAALTLLDRLTELPVTEHAAVFEHVHAELTAVLGQLDPESAGADD